MKDLRQEALRWLRQAPLDLAFLPVAQQAGKYDTCCFLAQQTAEKALTANGKDETRPDGMTSLGSSAEGGLSGVELLGDQVD